MRRLGRRQFLGALAGAMALLPLKRLQQAAQTLGKPGTPVKPLKAAIVYYSATGNTAKVAKAIQRGVKQAGPCDLLKIKNANSKKIAQYDVIGIGAPIWFFREPANLKVFLHQLPPMDGKLCFLFCVHGSEPVGFFASLADSVLKKNFTIIGWNDWFGSVYQVLHMPKPYMTDGHPDAVDLAGAEAFGEEMADRARRITGGEKNVAPEIPQGLDVDALWIRHDLPESMNGPGPKTGSSIGEGLTGKVLAVSAPAGAAIGRGPRPARGPGGPGIGPPSAGGPPGGGGPPKPFAGRPKAVPHLNVSACVYPRCDACMFACPVDAIDLSMAAPARLASSALVIKEACISCGLCERMCVYDAITFDGFIPKSKHEIDMKKCTYPKCTICADRCPMHSIDLSTHPPTFHSDCEGCDLCYSLCPHDAISIPNLAQAQIPLSAAAKDPNSPFVQFLNKYAAVGRFRRLVPLNQVGWNNPAYLNKNAPRIVIDEDDEATYCDKPCKL